MIKMKVDSLCIQCFQSTNNDLYLVLLCRVDSMRGDLFYIKIDQFKRMFTACYLIIAVQ